MGVSTDKERDERAAPLSLPEGVEKGIWLARRVPLSSIPRWRRWLATYVARLVYFRWGVGLEGWIENQGFLIGSDAKERAEQLCKGREGWFWQETPINAVLPEETVQFGEHGFPSAGGEKKYRGRAFNLVAIDHARLRRELRRLHLEAKAL